MNYGAWKALTVVGAVFAAATLPGAFKNPPPAAVVPTGWSASPQDGKPLPPQPPAPIPKFDGPVVVLTGNERGFIRPCGCSKPKLGGIDRRAHAIAKLREKNPRLAAVSTGGLIAEGGRQQELKLDAFLVALSAMNYAAFVPGPDDFKIGAQALVERKGMCSFPMVLANAKVGETAFDGQAKLGDTGGVVVGLIEPMAPVTGVVVTSAAEALTRELKTCGEAAFVLVVYNGPQDHLEALADAVPEALRAKTTFAIPGHADMPIEMPKSAKGVPVVVPGGKGRAIGLFLPGKKPLFDSYTLVEKLPVDDAAAEILGSYRRFVREENLVTALNRTKAKAGYVGDGKCKECHAQAHDDLADTKHQKAMETLEKSGDDRDPECVKCHVTGWALDGGYVDLDKTPERKDIDCEQCHGPGSDHVASLAKTPGGKVDQATCIKCHDPDNSPQFKFETYWPKIVHR